MIRRSVVVAPAARADLLAVYDYIAAEASQAVALAYVQRIETWLVGFDIGAERGTRRDDIRSGLRVIGFERRVTAAFVVSGERVLILRLFYGGQDRGGALSEG
ncbi:type II toxin-antitoxin system RelE/ParE family toxin [Phenylobacterium sp.]|uniref:type II toxin-antitoxin system RelE/ParE family toxin n=1 Tax=Phenylobacterium sp. TaxID=1871053 RepID=UPI002E35725C|nr:type II toxin-antitoxin system RelE/ParE family toxin [Phenylobacterium sp.]HEX3365011.1 type II toxin-antitoxin system RelE/ParE family toxin [Phenylobacterium sp.]